MIPRSIRYQLFSVNVDRACLRPYELLGGKKRDAADLTSDRPPSPYR